MWIHTIEVKKFTQSKEELEMSVLGALEPARVMHYFEEICGIPHGSGNTKKISDYCVSFAKEHHLTYLQDEYNLSLIHI